jgi:hypothetical protein
VRGAWADHAAAAAVEVVQAPPVQPEGAASSRSDAFPTSVVSPIRGRPWATGEPVDFAGRPLDPRLLHRLTDAIRVAATYAGRPLDRHEVRRLIALCGAIGAGP